MTPDSEITSEALSLLSLCELFGDIDLSALDASEAEIVRLERGDVLLKQGDPSDAMYAVIRGRLQVLAEGQEGEQNLIGELGSGEMVGELGVLDGSPRMATIVAVRDSELVRVGAAGFNRLVLSNADSLNTIARAEAERMRNMGKRRGPVAAVRAIAVTDAGPGAGFDRFTIALCKALGEAIGDPGSVLHLSKARFEAIYRQTFEADGAIAGWLTALENAYRFVVYETDAGAELSAWTMHCLRQADRILLVGDAAGSAIPSKAAGPGAAELVLLHENDANVFSGTAEWLAGRTVIRHHHVRLHTAGDVARVARFLAGNAIGLTLGGGGARGFAHIGVLRALEEAGIAVDMVSGVSMGAIIAALYAMGHNWRELLNLAKKELTRKMTSDFALPIVALSSGRKFRRVLWTFFSEIQIEDLGLDFFCTSCNLSTSEMMIHRTGSLRDAVYASNAIPVILPPFLAGGQILIDGGVLNNQPGDVMKKLCGGAVIVSNVSPRRDVTVDSSFAEMPSAWRILRSRLNPFEPTLRVPGISATMLRTLMVASERKSREVERMSDFYLRPPIEGFRVDDYERIEEIAEVGYQHAREQISMWVNSGRLNGRGLPAMP